MVLQLYRANHVERLLEQFLEVLAQPSTNPFQPEWVMVQNPGMSVWLSRKLADYFGVCSGIQFLFPRKVVQQVFAAVLGTSAEFVRGFDPARLIWSILAELPNLLDQASFAALTRYLADDPGDRKRIQLARRIADTFDQYALYRPEMVTEWEQLKTTSDWQEHLWQSVSKQLGGSHIAHLALEFKRAVDEGRSAEQLPARICCFGISTLPPLYVHILELLSPQMEIHFFLLQPTQEFFADIRSRKEITRFLSFRTRLDEEALYLSEGHPLLASMGQMGREFQQVLLDATQFQDHCDFADPQGTSLLSQLQFDMLHLIQRSSDTQRQNPVALDPKDHSLSIHACHSPMREVEVLRDQLLDRFKKDPSLSPGDVVVMMPEVDTYAPLIEACFGVGGAERLPFAIADRAFRGSAPVVDAFFRVLDLASSRVNANEVLDLLGLDPVARRFQIDPSELETLADWVHRSGICWGIDAQHREQFGQPAVAQNTWRFGLDRLLLGYALPDDLELFEGVLPLDQVEGIEARLLGRFAAYCNTLFERLTRLAGRRTVSEWQALLLELLEKLVFAEGENEWQHKQVRTALDNLVQEAADGGFTETLELTALRSLLEDRIEDENEGWNFLADGITFCAMVPMRSIPFRIVAMMGLNDGAFPRTHRRESFDKLAEKPRVGDRSKRDEERYLFLEALLAAREQVIITYVGQGLKDNAPLPPSVVVSELLDCLAESFVLPDRSFGDREAMVHRLVLRHPMQGFNPIYFNEAERPELFSYSKSHFQGALGFVEHTHVSPSLFSAALAPEEPSQVLLLEDLVQFYGEPIAAMMKRRLGFNFSSREQLLAEREPLDLGRLETHHAGTKVVEQLLAGLDPDQIYALARAEGRFPIGTPGLLAFKQLVEATHPFVHRIQQWIQVPLPTLEVSLPFGPKRLEGSLEQRYQKGLVHFAFTRKSGKHLLRTWARHLALCCVAPHDQELVSVWLGRGSGEQTVQASFRPVDQPSKYLKDLIELFEMGQVEPLLFFPKTSFAYAGQEDEGKALKFAQNAWQKDTYSESLDDHNRRTFGEAEIWTAGFNLFGRPMNAGDFPTLARRVFGPLLAHLTEEVIGGSL